MANPVGNEIIQALGIAANGQPAATTEQFTVSQIASANVGLSSTTAISSQAGVGASTIPAVSIFTKIVSRTGATAAFTDTTDTAANIIALMGANAAIGQTFQFTYDNNTNFIATLTGGTGVTVSGVTVIPAGSYVRYLVTYTAANTLTFVGFEGGTIATQVNGAQFTAVAGNTPLTLTGAQVGGAADVTINLTAALAGAGTATLPTVANLVVAIPNASVGQGYNLRIINSSSGAFAWTVTTNTGWTLTGTMTIAQNTFRDFVVTLNSLTAATLQQVGTGTTS